MNATKGKQEPPRATTQRIFAYLDGELAASQQAAFEAEAARDPVLAADVSKAQAVFQALATLDDLSPATDFSVRTMARLHLRPSPWARLWGWVAGAGHTVVRNPLAALVEGDLSRRHANAVAAFAASDPDAAVSLASWKRLLERLESLPVLAPGPALPVRVMAQVPVAQAPRRRSGTAALFAEWARKLLPRPQERLAAASGAVFGPAAVVASVFWVVFSNPLVRASDVVGFVAAKIGTAVAGLAGAFFGGMALGGWGFWQEATVSAPAVATGLAAFGALAVASGWVLYKNVKVSVTEERYAPA